jgi:ketosteroid isomerase-like protein
MKKHLILCLFLAGLIFTSCMKSGPSISEAEQSEIEKQVSEQWTAINEALEKSDAAAYGTFFKDNEFLGMTSQGASYKDWKTYLDTVGVWFGNRTSCKVEQKDLQLNVLSKRFLMLHQKSVITANFKDSSSLKINHVVSFLFKKQDETWSIIHGHESWNPAL